MAVSKTEKSLPWWAYSQGRKRGNTPTYIPDVKVSLVSLKKRHSVMEQGVTREVKLFQKVV